MHQRHSIVLYVQSRLRHVVLLLLKQMRRGLGLLLCGFLMVAGIGFWMDVAIEYSFNKKLAGQCSSTLLSAAHGEPA